MTIKNVARLQSREERLKRRRELLAKAQEDDEPDKETTRPYNKDIESVGLENVESHWTWQLWKSHAGEKERREPNLCHEDFEKESDHSTKSIRAHESREENFGSSYPSILHDIAVRFPDRNEVVFRA